MRGFIFASGFSALILGFWSGGKILFPAPTLSDYRIQNGAGLKPDQVEAETAVALASSPLQSDLWLVLSEARASLPSKTTTDSALEMAYLTGGEKAEDIPRRLERAVESRAFTSKTIQDFVRVDVGLVLRRAPDLRPALADAARKATPNNKAIFEALLRDVDPDLDGVALKSRP